MNAITATIGADVAPFKKNIESLPQLAEATSKKLAAAAKKQADFEKRQAEEIAKHRVEMQKRMTQGVTNLTGGLASAGNGAQAVSAGLGAIGGLALGAGATIGLQVISGLADKMGEAVDSAREFRDLMASVRAAQSGASRSTEGDITAHLEQSIKAAEEASKRLNSPRMTAFKEGMAETQSSFVHGDGTAGRLMDAGASLFGTIFDTIAPGRIAGKNAGSVTDSNTAAQKDVERMVEKREEAVRLRETELHVSERQAALDRVELELEEKKGAIIDMQVAAAKRNVALDVRGLTAAAEKSAALERAAIQKKVDDAARDVADEKISTADRLKVSLMAMVSPLTAQRMEVERLTKEYQKQLDYSEESGITDEKRIEYQKRMNALLEQRNVTEESFKQKRAILPPAQVQKLDRQDKANKRRAERNKRANEDIERVHARADEDRGKADTKENKKLIGSEKERREQNTDGFFAEARKRSAAERAKAGVRGVHVPDAFENEVFRQKIMQGPASNRQFTPGPPVRGPGVDRASDSMQKAADAIMQLLPLLNQPARIA
jgi:hypothetical protein